MPVKHALYPVEESVVYERQNRPSQRALLKASETEHPIRRASKFCKREASQFVNHPRGITQINATDKREYSAYVYAFVDEILKKQPWYAFSKKPVEVAERVAAVAYNASYVSLTDFSRMDGRVSNVCRYLEKLVMTASFDVMFHNQMLDLMQSQHHLAGKTAFGVWFYSEWERLSGSAETSAFNTMENACIIYVAYRLMGSGPEMAWDLLGIFGGDDGVSADLAAAQASRAAAWFGQKLECVKVERGSLGVQFLARRYGPNVGQGNLPVVVT